MHIPAMAMTLDQIVEETLSLSKEQVAELVDRLTMDLHQSADPALEAAWKKTTRRRLDEIGNGTVQGIPGEEVSVRIRQIVGR